MEKIKVRNTVIEPKEKKTKAGKEPIIEKRKNDAVVNIVFNSNKNLKKLKKAKNDVRSW